MYRLTCIALLASLQETYISAVPPSAILNQVCKQCDSWCPARLMRGPRGPKGEPGVDGLDGHPGERGEHGDPGHVGYVDMQPISQLINEKLLSVIPDIPKTEESPIEGCHDVRQKLALNQSVENGVFNITFHGLGDVEVYCDFTTDGGDWLVFQRRMDGSVDFYRDWNSYVHGFGNKDEEFWLGLEKIHQLTSLRRWELRIDLITKGGEGYFARYRKFRIGSRRENYKLDVAGFRGNTSDSFRKVHFGQNFSTYDMDLDTNPNTNCAEHWRSAWWYSDCFNFHSNLNGNYDKAEYQGIGWYKPSPHQWLYMQFTEMKIRLQR